MILKALMTRLSFMSVLLMPALPNAAATVNTCRDAKGHVAYSDQPCKASAANASSTPTVTTPSPPASPHTDDSPYRLDVYKRPNPVVVPPLPKVDLSGFPKDAAGNAIFMQSGATSLVAEPGKPSAVTFVARCSALVTRCFKPGERSLDACFMSAPRCASSRPWADKAQENSECCVTECWQHYEKARIAGKAPLSAYDAALFGADSCIPEAKMTGLP